MTNDEKRDHMARMGKVWAALWILIFGAEAYAVAKGGGTLSTFIRRYFRISDKQPLKYQAPRWIGFLLIIVLAIHFIWPS